MESCDKKPISCSCLKIISQELFDQHKKNDCPEEQIECSSCKTFFKRKDIGDHVETCPEQMVNCQFQCGFTGKRKNLIDHLNSDIPQHFMLAMKSFSNEINFLKKELEEKTKLISNLEQKLNSTNSGIWNFIPSEFLFKIKPQNEEFYGEGWKKITLSQLPDNARNILINLNIVSGRISKRTSLPTFRINFRKSSGGLPSVHVDETIPLSEINSIHSSTKHLIIPLNQDKAFDYEASITVNDSTPLYQVANIKIVATMEGYQ